MTLESIQQCEKLQSQNLEKKVLLLSVGDVVQVRWAGSQKAPWAPLWALP